MNKLVKTILSVMAFGGVVGIAHAEVETASLWGGGGGSQHPEGCTELCGSKSIPIEITIPKVCELKNVTTKITLNSTTGTGTGGFSVGEMQHITYWLIPIIVLQELITLH